MFHSKTKSFLLAAWLCSQLALPCLAATPEKTTFDLPPSSPAEIQGIRAAYDAFSERATVAGNPIRFELSEFQTVMPDKFKEYGLTELFTLETPRYIQVQSKSLNKKHVRFTSLKLDWINRSAEEADRVQRGLRKAHQIKIRDLKMKGTGDGEDQPMDPFGLVTTFKVKAELMGEAVDYRAAVLWQDLPHAKAENATYSMRDFVVRGMGTIVNEPGMVIAWSLMEDQEKSWLWRGERPAEAPLKLSGSQGCEVKTFTSNTTSAIFQNSGNGHSSGKHEAALDVQASCRHNQDCTVGCTPSFKVEVCRDYGGIAGALCFSGHAHWETKLEGNSGFNEAVTCSGAMGCQIEHCCVGNCSSGNVTVSFSGGPANLSASSSGYDYKFDISDKNTCPPPTAEPHDEDPGDGDPGNCTFCDSPILFDFGEQGLDLSAVSEGVLFDIDGDAKQELVSWPFGEDAFLVLDRNFDRRIDDGYELFGSYTPQHASSDLEPNGFTALKVYDSPLSGGNGDGWLDADDSIYPLLRVWQDRNRDGEVGRSELFPLTRLGIQGLGLDIFERRMRDEHGNDLRYWGVYIDKSGDSAPLIDVFLLKEEF